MFVPCFWSPSTAINRNMGCIEITPDLLDLMHSLINRNMGCIEMYLTILMVVKWKLINRNMGCIEIFIHGQK